MTSGDGNSGAPSGDGASAGRGSAGEQPRPDRIGSARVVIGMASLILTLLSLFLWLVTSRERDGLLLLVTIFAVTFIWAIGAFTRSFWTS